MCCFQAASVARGSLAQDAARCMAAGSTSIVLRHDQRAGPLLEIVPRIVGAGEQDFLAGIVAESMREDRGGRLRERGLCPMPAEE